MGKRLSKGGPDTLTQTMSSSSARQRAAVTTRAAQRMRAHSVLGNLQDGVKSAVNQQLDVVKPAARESHRLRSCAGLRLPRAGRARCQCARSALVPLPATGSSLGIYFDHLALDMVLQLRMAAAALQLLLAGHADSLRVAPEMRLTALGETLTAAQRAWLHSNASQVVRGGAFAAPTFDRNRTANATSLYYTPDDKSDPRKHYQALHLHDGARPGARRPGGQHSGLARRRAVERHGRDARGRRAAGQGAHGLLGQRPVYMHAAPLKSERAVRVCSAALPLPRHHCRSHCHLAA